MTLALAWLYRIRRTEDPSDAEATGLLERCLARSKALGMERIARTAALDLAADLIKRTQGGPGLAPRIQELVNEGSSELCSERSSERSSNEFSDRQVRNIEDSFRSAALALSASHWRHLGHELLSQATLERIRTCYAASLKKEDGMTTTLMYVEAECRLALSEADTAMYSGERPFVRAASIMVDLKPKCEKRRLFKAMWRRTACILLVEMSLLKGMVHRAQAS